MCACVVILVLRQFPVLDGAFSLVLARGAPPVLTLSLDEAGLGLGFVNVSVLDLLLPPRRSIETGARGPAQNRP